MKKQNKTKLKYKTKLQLSESNPSSPLQSFIHKNQKQKKGRLAKNEGGPSLRRSQKNYFFFKNDEEQDIFEGDQIINSQIVEKRSKKLIHPHSKFKIIWNIIMIIFILYIALMMPFRFAFIQSSEVSLGWVIIDFIVDLIFMADIVINFLSSYYDKDNVLVESRVRIAKNYLKSWFILDFISSLPLEFILKIIEDSNNIQNSIILLKLARLPRIYKLMRLIKLIRLYKSNKFLQKLLQKLHIKSEMKSIIKLFFILIFLIHSIACIWYLGASLYPCYQVTWPSNINIAQGDVGKAYVASIYWAVQAITTVGFGDIPPQTPTEYLISCAIFFIGVAIYTFMISKLANLFSAYNKERNFISQKLKAVENFIEQSHISEDLGQRMIYYFQKNTSRAFLAQNYQIEDLKEDLPKNLSVQLALHIHRDSINTIRFLQCRTKQFYTQILPNLKPIQMKKGSSVYQKGSKCNEVYFILEGEVRRDGRDKVFKKSTFFGETDIILNQRPRQETLIVQQNAKLLTLEKSHFLDLVIRFSDIRHQMKYIAFNREYERLFHIHGEDLDIKQLYNEISQVPMFSFPQQNEKEIFNRNSKTPGVFSQNQLRSKNFRSKQIRRAMKNPKNAKRLKKSKQFVIERDDKKRRQQKPHENLMSNLKANLESIQNQPQMKDLKIQEKQFLEHQFDPSVAIQEHIQQLENRLRKQNIDQDQKDDFNDVHQKKEDQMIEMLNRFEKKFKTVNSDSEVDIRKKKNENDKEEGEEESSFDSIEERLKDNSLYSSEEDDEDEEDEEEEDDDSIKKQTSQYEKKQEQGDDIDDEDKDESKQELEQQTNQEQIRKNRKVSNISLINTQQGFTYYDNIAQLQSKVRLTGEMIEQAVIMISNAKKLISTFVELFSRCLKEEEQNSYLFDVIKSGMVGLQNYLFIIDMIEKYLEQRKNSPFLLELKSLSLELQEIQKKQVFECLQLNYLVKLKFKN